MRSGLLVETLVVGEGAIGGLDGEVAVVPVPELDAGGVFGAFDKNQELPLTLKVQQVTLALVSKISSH